jgi:hypothetical protein
MCVPRQSCGLQTPKLRKRLLVKILAVRPARAQRCCFGLPASGYKEGRRIWVGMAPS